MTLGKPMRQGSRQDLQRRGYSNARSSFDERDLGPGSLDKAPSKAVHSSDKVMFSVEETTEHLHGRRRAVSRSSPMLNGRSSVGSAVSAISALADASKPVRTESKRRVPQVVASSHQRHASSGGMSNESKTKPKAKGPRGWAKVKNVISKKKAREDALNSYLTAFMKE